MIARPTLVSRLVTVLYPEGVPVAHVPLLPRLMALLDVAAGSVAEGREVSVPLALMQGEPCPYEPSDVSELSDEPVPFALVGPESAPVASKPLTGFRPQGGRQGTDWAKVPGFWTESPTKLASQNGVSASAVYKARAYFRANGGGPDRHAEPAPVVAESATTAELTPPASDRQRELNAIEAHVKTKGVTRFQATYVEPDSIPAHPRGGR